MFAPNARILRPRVRNSLQAHALGWLMSLSVRPIATGVRGPWSMRLIRQLYPITGVVMGGVPDHVQVTPVRRADVRGEWICPEDTRSPGKVILYLHGGGYFFGSAAQHRPITWRLADSLGRPVFSANYRMAPRYTFEHWQQDAVASYRYLLACGYRGEDITVGGDSAGGHLTLVLLQTLRDLGEPLPGCAVCISPWTDLSEVSVSRRGNDWRDPMLPPDVVRQLGRFLGGERDLRHPLLSPVYGDFRGLPPLYMVAGSTEILRDDARRTAVRAREAGVMVQYEEWHRMPHVFPLFAAVLPEARSAFRHITRLVEGVERLRTLPVQTAS